MYCMSTRCILTKCILIAIDLYSHSMHERPEHACNICKAGAHLSNFFSLGTLLTVRALINAHVMSLERVDGSSISAAIFLSAWIPTMVNVFATCRRLLRLLNFKPWRQ